MNECTCYCSHLSSFAFVIGACFTTLDEDLTKGFAIYCGVSVFQVSLTTFRLAIYCKYVLALLIPKPNEKYVFMF